MVDCRRTIPYFIDRMDDIVSTAPAAPSKWPVIDLVEFKFMV
jgi:hypothetical protein